MLAGPGAAAGAGSELRAGGVAAGRGALALVADAAVLDLGLTEPIEDSARAAGFEVVLCAPVADEPTADSVAGVLAEISGGPFAAVAAVGGGSALDVGKLVSLALANELDLTRGFDASATVDPGPPLLAIPTTAGTGAEATAVAMLWHDGLKRMFVHPYLVPRMAILDPQLVAGLPGAVTAASGLDAISHAVEALLSTFRTPLTEAASRQALAALATSLPQAYATGGADDRFATLLGAYHAGLALNAQVVLGHSIAYTIAAHAGLPHGVSCAMALPYCLAHCRSASEPQIAEMARLACQADDPGRFVNWLLEMNRTMGIPASLAQVGIEAQALPGMVHQVLERYPRPNHPVEIEATSLERLLERFHRGQALEAWADGSGDRGDSGGSAG